MSAGGCAEENRLKTCDMNVPALAIALALSSFFLLANPLIAAPPLDFAREVRPFLQSYCATCHNANVLSAGLNLELLTDPVSLQQRRERVLEVIHALETGAMPPKRAPQPSDTLRAQVAHSLRYQLENFDFSRHENPGYLALHRLTTTQYRNTIRDLIGVGEEISENLPADESTHGFDHIAEAQDVSAAHIEQYLDAARYVLDRLFLPPARTWKYEAEQLPYVPLFGGRTTLPEEIPANRVGASEHVFIRNGGVVFTMSFPHTGLYRVRLRAWGSKVANVRGNPGLKIKLDSHKVAEPRIPLDGPSAPSVVTSEFIVRQGRHDLKIEMDGMGYDASVTGLTDRYNRVGLDFIEVIGPVPENEELHAKIRSNLLIAAPGPNLSARQAAGRVLGRFLPLAFRRPAKPAEVDKAMAVFDHSRARGKSFEQALRVSLESILISPNFLLHVEEPRSTTAPYRIGDFELANRLSYFLWSSMPDAELFALAAQNRLHEPDVLRRQTRRMLQDPKAKSLAEKFAPQWLALGSLFAIHKEGAFHENNLSERQMLLNEIVLFFDSVVRENRSIFDLIDADYTFVDHRLAKHYGIADVTGREWRRVKLEGTVREQRGGLLTTAGVLLAHSQSYHTNPSGRGRWILDSWLGTPPPPPPPSVQPLERPKNDDPLKLTLRERLSQHRNDPACASCHAKIDPLGFAFENYDVVGKWRDMDSGRPVDASGQLAGTKPFNGPAEVKKILAMEKKDLFVRNFSKRMLTYGLRRGLKFYDEVPIRDAVAALERNEFRIGALIECIVSSYAFQYRQNPPN
jgi:hypothetical protein